MGCDLFRQLPCGTPTIRVFCQIARKACKIIFDKSQDPDRSNSPTNISLTRTHPNTDSWTRKQAYNLQITVDLAEIGERVLFGQTGKAGSKKRPCQFYVGGLWLRRTFIDLSETRRFISYENDHRSILSRFISIWHPQALRIKDGASTNRSAYWEAAYLFAMACTWGKLYSAYARLHHMTSARYWAS